jgi:O-methyltransferase
VKTPVLPTDLEKVAADVEDEVLRTGASWAVIGDTPTTIRILERLQTLIARTEAPPIYATTNPGIPGTRPLDTLADTEYDMLVIAEDQDKEAIIAAALPFIRGTPKLVVGGYAHLSFHDELFEQEQAQLLVPSIANGYPNTLPHLYQCLQNAARLELEGAVVEFGTFMGGTAMLLARLARALGRDWRVVTFDTFDGFPARKSPLDMYDHPDCVFTDEAAVRRYFDGWPIDLVVGDICDTAGSLGKGPIVLTFIDTDNYSSAAAAVAAVRESTVVGGAIVFDHFTGVDRFRYTLGERIAGKVLLNDKRYFHLHGTGVFLRQT